MGVIEIGHRCGHRKMLGFRRNGHAIPKDVAVKISHCFEQRPNLAGSTKVDVGYRGIMDIRREVKCQH